MRYVVLGCGAIGGAVAAGLARAGHDVLACDSDPAVVAAINERGLRVTGPVEDFTVALPAVPPDGLPARLDGPVLLAVKSHHTGAAAAALAGRLQGDGYVVSLQNGLNAGRLAGLLGPRRVVEAMVNFGADVLEPGVVLRGNRATFLVGELDGSVSGRIEALAADIADARVTRHILGYLWAKEAYGAMLFATAVSDLPIAAVLGEPRYAPMLTELARQVLAQVPAGVTPMAFDGFDPGDLDGSLARLTEFNRQSAKSHSGIYRDLAVRRRARLRAAIDETLAGADVLAGPTVGYPAPEQDPPFGVGDDSAESRFTGPYNLTGHPAISIPAPAPGLPVGLQLAAARGADVALLRVAAAAERLLARTH